MFLIRPSPFLNGATRHVANIYLRLRRQRPLSRQPVTDALGASVVGGGCQSKIAKSGPQLAHELGRFREGLDRIERIVQMALRSRHRHELSDTLRPLTRTH